MKKIVISTVVSSLIVCVLFVLIQNQITPPTANASWIATSSKVKKDIIPPSVSTSTLEQYPIGTQFTVHPGSSFAVVNPTYTVHVSSLTVELTAKNSLDEYLKDTSLGTGSQKTFFPYEITLSMSGHLEGSFTQTPTAVFVYFTTNSGTELQLQGRIDENRDFIITEKLYWNVPIEIWLSRINYVVYVY